MVKHQNSIPKAHFKKHWQKYVKVDFNRAMKKKKRRNCRIKKTGNLKINKLPKNNVLKPIVHNPTKMYNLKIRLGRGFSIGELKNSIIPKNMAPSIGISMDKRRRGNSLKQISNVKRLNNYFEKIGTTELQKKSEGKSKNETGKFIKIIEKKIKKNFLMRNESNLENSNFLSTTSLEAIQNLQSLK